MVERARVLIGTPVYEDQVTVPYHRSLMGLTDHFRRAHPGVQFDSSMIAATLVEQARNALVTIILSQPAYTHLLFVDSDMGFRPSLIEKMLAFDRPFVGCAYPARREGGEFIGAVEVLYRDEAGRPVTDGDFVRVVQCGAGISLVKREMLEALASRWPHLWAEPGGAYPRMGVHGRVFQPFSPIQREQDGHFLTEDLSFCKRWRGGCGGELWACFTETIEHVGRRRYVGSAESLIRAEMARSGHHSLRQTAATMPAPGVTEPSNAPTPPPGVPA